MPHRAHEIIVFTPNTTANIYGNVTNQISVSPADRLKLKVNGIGYVQITFVTTVPPQLQQYATSPNTVMIPVFGSLSISLTGVVSVTPVNVSAEVEKHYSSLATSVTTPVSISNDPFKNVTISISSNNVVSITHEGTPIPPVQFPIFYVGDYQIQFVGYGVTFTAQDYDPIARVPAGNPTLIDLTSGTPSNFAEAPSNKGITILRSYTGYILLSNFNGSGVVNLALSQS